MNMDRRISIITKTVEHSPDGSNKVYWSLNMPSMRWWYWLVVFISTLATIFIGIYSASVKVLDSRVNTIVKREVTIEKEARQEADQELKKVTTKAISTAVMVHGQQSTEKYNETLQALSKRIEASQRTSDRVEARVDDIYRALITDGTRHVQ